MTTASDIVSRSLRLIGVLGQGRRTLTANELSDGLDALNSMLESFSLERLMVYQILEESFPLVIGTGSYSIGVGGTFNTTRPVKVENAFLRDTSNNDYPLALIDNSQYDSIPLKTVRSRPIWLFYDTQDPLAYVRLMYPPAYADTLYLNSWKQLQQFSSGSTVLALPPGYKRMIEYNLAVELQAEYPGSKLSPVVTTIASQSKANLKRINSKIPIADVSESAMTIRGRGKRNIFTG